jgi:hypothetical protein
MNSSARRMVMKRAGVNEIGDNGWDFIYPGDHFRQTSF